MTAGDTEVEPAQITQPQDLVEMVEALRRLPNNLSVRVHHAWRNATHDRFRRLLGDTIYRRSWREWRH